MGEVLAAMRTFLSAAESALSIPPPTISTPESEPLNPWPASQSSGSTITSPLLIGTFFVAIGLAIWIVGSFWDFNGRVPWQSRLDLVTARLPYVALLAGAWALLVTLFVPKRPLLWAFQVSWPLVLHAALVGGVYLAIRASRVPELQQALGAELAMIPAGLGTAAAAAGVGLGGGFAGAILGKRLSSMVF